jgi:hypothetical protein
MDTDEVVFAPIQVLINELKGAVEITHPMLALGTSAVAYAQALEDDMSLKYPDTVWGIIVVRNVKDQDDFHGLEVTGTLLESVLKWRCIWKQYTFSGTVPAAIEDLLTKNFISPLDTNRAVPWVALENAPAVMTDTISFEQTGVYVSSQVYAVLALYEVGIKAIYDKYKNQVRFYLYKGKDRSLSQSTLPYVVFSDENGMLVEPKYTEDNGNYKNVALVAGEDTDPNGTTAPESIYEEAVSNGYTGTQEQFFQNLGQPDWTSVRNKPTTFVPSSHQHLWADITDKPTTFTPTTHEHTSSNITDLTDIIANAIAEAKLAEHPIGDLIFNTSGTNPGTYLGGTWVAWGSGRVPVGVDTAQTEFNTVEKTGGAKTHTLVIAEMPKHRHNSKMIQGASNAFFTANDSPLVGRAGEGTEQIYDIESLSDGVGFMHPVGGGTAHNNLQPYITCYMWKRTA